jgi:hypothetical protein
MTDKCTNAIVQPQKGFGLISMPIRCLLMLLSLAIPCQAANWTNLSYRFNLWNEATVNGINGSSPFNPDNKWLHLPTASNLFLTEGAASYTFGQQFKIIGGFYNRYAYSAGSHDQLRLKELFMNWSLGAHWDLAAGKKILRWGTGYAWTPTGVLDPRRDPRDPTDRLSQYEGKELIELRGTFAGKSITAVYSSPHLFLKLQTRRQEEQWAVKYSALFRKLDYSIIASFGGLNQGSRYGGNATYVLGQALELHGEFIAQRSSPLSYPLAITRTDPNVTFTYPPYALLKENDGGIYCKSLIGVNYTFPSGWNLIVEYYRDGQGLSSVERRRFDSFVLYNEGQQRLLAGEDSIITLPAANLLWTLQGISGFNRAQDYLFARISRDRIARKWSFENMAIFSFRDGSSIWIPQASYDFSGRIGIYLRYTYYVGKRNSEFGSLPFRSTLNLGLALRF